MFFGMLVNCGFFYGIYCVWHAGCCVFFIASKPPLLRALSAKLLRRVCVVHRGRLKRQQSSVSPTSASSYGNDPSDLEPNDLDPDSAEVDHNMNVQGKFWAGLGLSYRRMPANIGRDAGVVSIVVVFICNVFWLRLVLVMCRPIFYGEMLLFAF